MVPGSASHQFTCISVALSLPHTGGVTNAGGGSGSYGRGHNAFPAFSGSNGRKVKITVCAPAGCDTKVELSFSGQTVGQDEVDAEFGQEGSSPGWTGEKELSVTGTGDAEFRMRGNNQDGPGKMIIKIKDSDGNTVCETSVPMKSRG